MDSFYDYLLICEHLQKLILKRNEIHSKLVCHIPALSLFLENKKRETFKGKYRPKYISKKKKLEEFLENDDKWN